MNWHAVDAQGRAISSSRASPAAALAAITDAAWPLGVVAHDGCRLTFAQALGPNGGRVQELLDAVDAGVPEEVREQVARETPAGTVALPLDVVALPEGARAAALVDADWLQAVDHRRAECRQALVEAGREAETEAALHVAMLLATERFDPAVDVDVDVHIASGARLWLLTGAVVSALAGGPDRFEGWARLVTAGWWPVGPSGGRLVVSAA